MGIRDRYCFIMCSTVREEELKEKVGSGVRDNIERAVQVALDWLDEERDT